MAHHPLPADIGAPPDPDLSDRAIDAWALARARRLIDEVDLVCDGRRHRIHEVELYLNSAQHPDPFVHGGPHQHRAGGWYFHRSGESYRGGTFKGLDFTTGDPRAACAWLLRTIETADGRLINGSCNVVDHLLAISGDDGPGPLDTASPDALDPGSRLHLAPAAKPRPPGAILTTPRVGLTLRRAAHWPLMPAYIGRRLRFLDAPRRIKKGRIQTVAALLADGVSLPDIEAATGSRIITLRRAAAAFESGRARHASHWSGIRLTAAAQYGLYAATLVGRQPPELR